MIEFRDVAVRYPRADRDALAGVSFGAQRGAITAVVGPNGSGKSTLVRALIGRVSPWRGMIELDGEPVADVPRHVRAQRIAFVTQREELAFPVLVDEYVALGRFPHLGLWRAAGVDDRAAVLRAMTASFTLCPDSFFPDATASSKDMSSAMTNPPDAMMRNTHP